MFFIGPRCPWGPIYGSGCLSLTDSLSPRPLCRLNWCDSGWWRYKLNTNWCKECKEGIPRQCKWHNLVANFGTKQYKWRQLMTKFWINLQQIRNAYSKEIQIWFQEIWQIWSLEMQQHLSPDLAVRQSRPCQHVSWFWFLPEEVGRVHTQCKWHSI